LSVIFYPACSITDEAARRYELTKRVHRWNRMARRERNDLLNAVVEKNVAIAIRQGLGHEVDAAVSVMANALDVIAKTATAPQ
jgi:hypothetical protein